MKFYSFHPGMKLTCKQKFFHPEASFILGWDFISVTCKRTLILLWEEFWKTNKKNEDQGEKQIKAIQDQRQVKTIKKYIYDNEDAPLISKQKQILNELVDERLDKITDLDKKSW